MIWFLSLDYFFMKSIRTSLLIIAISETCLISIMQKDMYKYTRC